MFDSRTDSIVQYDRRDGTDRTTHTLGTQDINRRGDIIPVLLVERKLISGGGVPGASEIAIRADVRKRLGANTGSVEKSWSAQNETDYPGQMHTQCWHRCSIRDKIRAGRTERKDDPPSRPR